MFDREMVVASFNVVDLASAFETVRHECYHVSIAAEVSLILFERREKKR